MITDFLLFGLGLRLCAGRVAVAVLPVAMASEPASPHPPQNSAGRKSRSPSSALKQR